MLLKGLLERIAKANKNVFEGYRRLTPGSLNQSCLQGQAYYDYMNDRRRIGLIGEARSLD